MTPLQKNRFIAHATKRLFDHKALYAQLVITRNCNLSCAYCNELWGGMKLYEEHARALLAGDFSKQWKCLGGSKFLYINTNGHIQWCSQQTGADLPLIHATPHDLAASNCHKPCEAGCAVGCSRLISHALGEPLKSVKTGLRTIAAIHGADKR